MMSSGHIAELLKQASNGGREDHRRAMWNKVVRSKRSEYKLSKVHPAQLGIVKAAVKSADAFVGHMTERVCSECVSGTGPTPDVLKCLPALPAGVLDEKGGWTDGLNPLELHRYLCEMGFTRRIAADAWNWFLLVLRWAQAGHMGEGDLFVQALTDMTLADIQSCIGRLPLTGSPNKESMKQIDNIIRPIVQNTGGIHTLYPTAFVHHCPPAAAWWRAELIQEAMPHFQGHITIEEAYEMVDIPSHWEVWARAVFLGTPRVAPAVAFAGYLIALNRMDTKERTTQNLRQTANKLARRCRGLHVHDMNAADLAEMALA